MFQLRYLQTLNSISAEKNSTIIFPFPMELLSQWGAMKPGGSSEPATPRIKSSAPTQEAIKELAE